MEGNDAPTPDARPHVVILGGGFGGLAVARGLADTQARITLIDRRNHHLFQPLLYQVATAGLSAPSIAAPLRQILRGQSNVTVLMDEALDVDLSQRRVTLADGELNYDALVVATGVELAGTLAEIARHTLPREFRRADLSNAHVLLVEAGPRLLPAFAPDLSDKARRQLEKLGVDVRLNTSVTAIDEHGVVLGDKPHTAGTVLWAAGVAASPLGRRLGAPLDRAGRVEVDAHLGLPGHPEVFVIGDLASVTQADGKPVPGVAPAAKQMGHYVANVLKERWRGVPSPPFRYRDDGVLATIGRMAAVAQFGRLKFSGLLAWWIWLVAHIAFLIGFRNRLVVMLDWAWAYWTYQRHARIVFGSDEKHEAHAPPPSDA